MRKLALLFLLLVLLPAGAFANDYAWTASHLIRQSDAPPTVWVLYAVDMYIPPLSTTP